MPRHLPTLVVLTLALAGSDRIARADPSTTLHYFERTTPFRLQTAYGKTSGVMGALFGGPKLGMLLEVDAALDSQMSSDLRRAGVDPARVAPLPLQTMRDAVRLIGERRRERPRRFGEGSVVDVYKRFEYSGDGVLRFVARDADDLVVPGYTRSRVTGAELRLLVDDQPLARVAVRDVGDLHLEPDAEHPGRASELERVVSRPDRYALGQAFAGEKQALAAGGAARVRLHLHLDGDAETTVDLHSERSIANGVGRKGVTRWFSRDYHRARRDARGRGGRR